MKFLAAQDFNKVPLIEAFISSHNFNILCLSETFLDLTLDLNNGNININGYSILKADHPSNSKQGGFCIYYKQSLPLMRRKTTVKQSSVNNKTCLLTCFYRSPSQDHDELHNSCPELNLRLTNINNNQAAFSILKFDFNEKCSKWCRSDKNNIAGLKIDNTATMSGYGQLINKQHIS